MLVYNLEQIIYLKAKSFFLLFIVRCKKSRLNENQPRQWNQCCAHRDSFVACQLLSLFMWQFVTKLQHQNLHFLSLTVVLSLFSFSFYSMLGLNDCNKEVSGDLNWTLVGLWCEEQTIFAFMRERVDSSTLSGRGLVDYIKYNILGTSFKYFQLIF